jgi:hypothetical protein
MTIPLSKNSSGDAAGNYFTALGASSKERYDNFKAVPAPDALGYKTYSCPGDVNYGPFVGSGLPKELGPVASNRPWTPFAAANNYPGALPLPMTIDSTVEGFKFSTPPVFNFGGHSYWPSLPEKGRQLAAQYYGNAQNDFRIAPATKNGNTYVPATFPVPTDKTAPYARLEGFSDWAATASLTNTAGQSVAVTFATGSPLAFVTFDKNTSYGCLTLSKLPTTPVRAWFPEGYRCQSPAGVSTEIAGADTVTDPHHPPLSLDVRVGKSGDESHEIPVPLNSKKVDLANALQRAFQSSALLDDGPVTPTVIPQGNFEFLLSARDRNIVITQNDVTAKPTSDAQVVLIPKTQSARPVDPPANASVVGITIGYEYTPGENATGIYYASYALIAPTGGRWTFDEQGHLVCDFTQATTETKTLIICAMPTLGADEYRQYDNPAYGVGAAATLRSMWQSMQRYAYGCPRHLTNGKDDGTGTRFGPNDGNRFTPDVKTVDGRTTVTTQFLFNLTYPAGQPAGASGTLFGLFPHQWRGYANNTANFLDKESDRIRQIYWTNAGPLRLAAWDGNQAPAFTTTYAFPGLLAHLPNMAGLTGAETFKVYDYKSTVPHRTIDQTLKAQMAQDAATPNWAADLSKTGFPRDFIPVAPVHQKKFSEDSYNWGKLVALVGDLIPAVNSLRLSDATKAAIQQLNAQLGQWLSGGLLYATASTPFPPGVATWQKARGNATFAGSDGLFSNQQFLYYDQQWSTLIPYPTGFDADTLINDHHFHYGYWLRAAAQLALAQARNLDSENAPGTFIKNYGATVNLIIKDIANPLRGDMQPIGANASKFPNGPAMPFMRYMDGYFGHSWASGLRVNVIDQESVSEAMSAWTGVIQWGELTKDTQLRDLGIWMYTHEMMSFYEYWMDCAQSRQRGSTFYPLGSPQTVIDDNYAVAMKGGLQSPTAHFFCHVFNGYRQQSTFFGWEPVYLTGIQWMPFHGGSLYLSSSDPAIETTLGKAWRWCYDNSKFLWDNYNNKVPLATLTSGSAIAAFVTELDASVNNSTPDKHITEGLRTQFNQIGFNLATRHDEDATKNRVICTKVDGNTWAVADFGGKTYTVARKNPALLTVVGAVDAYRPTLFATTWEPIAWQAIATIDPNCDQVFWNDPPAHSSKDVWGELEKAIGSPGDEKIYGKGWTPLLGQAVSSSYYWIYNVCQLGVRDATASADYPFAVKFIGPRGPNWQRRPTYVVWNMSDTERAVTFSDGKKITNVPPYMYKVVQT